LKRGEIYWADLAPRTGSEQKGRRPVIVCSHDGFNLTPGWKPIIVVPLSTSGAQAARGPTVVEIPAETTGLRPASTAVCHQVTALDRANLKRRIGVVPPDRMLALEEALKAAMDLH